VERDTRALQIGSDGIAVHACWPSLKMTMSASSVLMTMH
jgi:hypothetical protein